MYAEGSTNVLHLTTESLTRIEVSPDPIGGDFKCFLFSCNLYGIRLEWESGSHNTNTECQ